MTLDEHLGFCFVTESDKRLPQSQFLKQTVIGWLLTWKRLEKWLFVRLMVLRNAIEIRRGNGGVKQQSKSHVSTRKRTSGCQKSSWSKIGCISSNWGCWKRSTLAKARHPVVVKKVLLAVPNLSVLLWININVSFFLIKYLNNKENFLDYHKKNILLFQSNIQYHSLSTNLLWIRE